MFGGEWPDLARVPITETLVARADSLAWDYGLRGYDAIQLASALGWQESIGTEIVLATFDRELWEAGRQAGLVVWPEEPPGRPDFRPSIPARASSRTS
jgi:predicted nucleic acid-binding protein